MDISQSARDFFKSLQDEISNAVVGLHGETYTEDTWTREGGGGGVSRIFHDTGSFLEKGGVNFSEVHGVLTPEFAKSMPHGDGTQFYATGISLVLHPKNPFAPTVHANFRYLKRGGVGWFGGGADLTPVYVFEEDAIHFHRTFHETLKPFGEQYYPDFKKQCDEYFYLPHRRETRGIGGIFFDYQLDHTPHIFDLVKACGHAFLKAYIPIAKKRAPTPFTEHEKIFQEIRRGRYVEFNLIYDRGTVFGLKTNGRTESILMSLPLKARWEYNYEPAPGTPESELGQYLKPRDWLGLGGALIHGT